MFLNKKRIVKALVSTAVLTIIVTGLYGCGAGSAKTAVSDSKVNSGEYDMTAGASVSNPYTFTDDYGREVTVTSHKRVAALIGSFADIWVSAGGSLVAVHFPCCHFHSS